MENAPNSVQELQSDLKKWKSVSLYQFLALLFFAFMIFFFCLRGDCWFPILDSANLIFHEAGHPLVGLFSQNLSVYGGTIAQLVFPFICALRFFSQRAATSFAFSLLWFFESLFNIARYMRDARAQELPLVGGKHDWTEILTRWNLLESDRKLGASLTNFAILGILRTVSWHFQQWNGERIRKKKKTSFVSPS